MTDRRLRSGAGYDRHVQIRSTVNQSPLNKSPPSDAAERRACLEGSLWIVAAVLLWSSSSLFVKSTTFDDWPTESRGFLLAFWRALFAGALLLPAVKHPRWDPRLVPMTFCFALMNATFLLSMSMTTAANTIWLQSTAPFWVFLFGVLWLREPVLRANVAALAFGLCGTGVIVVAEFADEAHVGVIAGLVSGLAYAVVVICLRILRTANGAWLIALNHLVAAAALAPYVLVTGVWPSGRQLAVLAAFGLFQMGLPYVFFARGLRTMRTQEAALIGLLEPFLVPVWAFLVAGEVPASWTFAGAALILTGLMVRMTYALYVIRSRSRTKSK